MDKKKLEIYTDKNGNYRWRLVETKLSIIDSPKVFATQEEAYASINYAIEQTLDKTENVHDLIEEFNCINKEAINDIIAPNSDLTNNHESSSEELLFLATRMAPKNTNNDYKVPRLSDIYSNRKNALGSDQANLL